GRVVECGGLENRCPATVGPGVRIPPSPPKPSDQPRTPQGVRDFCFMKRSNHACMNEDFE
ncbi:MAG: hypothetical protein JXB49_35110, partial [Bacteroidales bacterium]|nr:hypothetical protein [Bacteroidales bacterium]